jgi:hypothetical protein
VPIELLTGKDLVHHTSAFFGGTQYKLYRRIFLAAFAVAAIRLLD